MAIAGRTRRRKAPERESRESLLLDREALRHCRVQRGHTQESLSRQRVQIDGESVGISYAQIRRIEKEGRAGPATARILAALLGVELGQLRPRDPRQLACSLPREVSVDFVGRRAELDTVLAVLGREGNVRIAASVEGLPGIGKTELALQVCAQLERARSHRIFWLDADEPDLTPQWAGAVARHLGIEHPDPRERVSLALRAIESLSEPTLIVLDNVERWSASEPWPRPRGRHIRWLVTTRVSRLGERAFEHVEVPVLDAASAAELLTRIAGPDVAERPGFADLLRHLDGYTIALELAAAFLARFPEVDPAEYLKVLLEGKGDLFEDEVKTLTAYAITLETSLDLLWHRLPLVTREAWELSACFAQEATSNELSSCCGLDRRARAELRDFHLIQSDSRSWSMHRLVRVFAHRRTAPPAAVRARSALVHGAAAYLAATSPDGAAEAYLRSRAHLDIALRYAESLRPEAQRDLAKLQRGVGEGRDRSEGTSAESLQLLDAAVAHYRREAERWGIAHGRVEYGRRQYDLARALYARNTRSFDADPIRGAVDACRSASAAFAQQSEPLEWAAAQRLVCGSLRLLVNREGGISLLEEAVRAGRAALTVCTRDRSPVDWAWAMRSLGAALTELGLRSMAIDQLHEAAKIYRGALEVFTREHDPFEWSAIQHLLGGVLAAICDHSGESERGMEAVLFTCSHRAETNRNAPQMGALAVHARHRLRQSRPSPGSPWAHIPENQRRILQCCA